MVADLAAPAPRLFPGLVDAVAALRGDLKIALELGASVNIMPSRDGAITTRPSRVTT